MSHQRELGSSVPDFLFLCTLPYFRCLFFLMYLPPTGPFSSTQVAATLYILRHLTPPFRTQTFFSLNDFSKLKKIKKLERDVQRSGPSVAFQMRDGAGGHENDS
jgi:hypothetical protein